MKSALALLCLLAAPALAQQPLPPPPPPPPPPPAEGQPANQGGDWATPGDTQQPPPQQQPQQAPPPERVQAQPDETAPSPQPENAPRPAQQPGLEIYRFGEGALVAAGSQAAPLHPNQAEGTHWRYALATGVLGHFGGYNLDESANPRANSGVLLYFGGQADGRWTSARWDQAVRLRVRMLTGELPAAQPAIYIPSAGDAEAAYMVGKPQVRFVIARAEVGSQPTLGYSFLGQFATLPSFEGSLAFDDDTMRLYYYVSPVAGVFVKYYGNLTIPGTDASWPSEDASPNAATAVRLRYSLALPPAVQLSFQGDLLKFWGVADTLFSAEAAAGYAVLDQSVLFNATIRYDHFSMRGVKPKTDDGYGSLSLELVASLVF